MTDKLLLRRRAIIESVIDQLKNISPPIAFPPSFPCQLFGQLGLWREVLIAISPKSLRWF